MHLTKSLLTIASIGSTVFALTNCDVEYPASNTTTLYPSKNEICNIFSNLEGPNANATAFFAFVSPTVNWTIEGTHPLAGQYLNRTLFAQAVARIDATGSESHPFEVSIVNIIGGGDEEWSVQELRVQAVCKNGLVFDNRYSWNTRWTQDGIIDLARAYLDSTLVSAALYQNEIGGLFTYSDLRDESVQFVTLGEEELLPATGLSLDKPAV